MKNFLEKSHHIVMIGVVGTFIASATLFLFGFAGIIYAIWSAIAVTEPFSYESIKEISVILIMAIDIFLLATVLYIIALGLYELFIDDALDLPRWLEVRTLDDLKARLLGVIAVILPVAFLGKLVEWKSGQDILWLGLAISAVLIAIAAIQYVSFIRNKS